MKIFFSNFIILICCSQGAVEDDSSIYSYSIITVDASSTISWLHHRMPVSMQKTDLIATTTKKFINASL